jgi:adenine deaminase
MSNFKISGNIVDIKSRRIFPGTLEIENRRIKNIIADNKKYDNYIMPGFIDAHIHIESSMLIPSEFARLAVRHGTVATVSDPHEIANVLGIKGVEYMITNGSQVPFKFYFGAPSCVPATGFETAGAKLGAEDIEFLFKEYDLKYLSEMMNFPGVLFESPDVMEKLSIAKKFGKPVDGHSPGLRGGQALAYADAGISTDHECFTLEEAREKISYGMKILIREGSAAKNFNDLHPLIKTDRDMIMFCSDDKHPDDLSAGHINETVKRAIALGYDLFDVLQIACLNPVGHYGLDNGCLNKGDYADFIVVSDLKEFKNIQTYINGELVSENGVTLIESIETKIPNNFNIGEKKVSDFEVEYKSGKIRIIEALEGQLITNEIIAEPKIENGKVVSDVENDILKITVVDRYKEAKPALGFIKNFGLKSGAIASCVGHDSHNIIATGTNDESLCRTVNAVIRNKGGIAIEIEGKVEILPLPVAGIMSAEDGFKVTEKYYAMNKLPAKAGCTLNSPYMTLSFMALLVIPSLKLGDKGLFDGNKFEFVDLFV